MPDSVIRNYHKFSMLQKMPPKIREAFSVKC